MTWAYAAIQAPEPNDPKWPDPPSGTGGYGVPVWMWPNPPYNTVTIPSPNPPPDNIKVDLDLNGDSFRFTHIVKSLNQRLVATGQGVSSLSTTEPDRQCDYTDINTARNDIEGLYDDFVKSSGAEYESYNDILKEVRDADNSKFGVAQAAGGVTWTSLNQDNKTVDVKADMESTDVFTSWLFDELELALAELVWIAQTETFTVDAITNAKSDGTAGGTKALDAGDWKITYTSGGTAITTPSSFWNAWDVQANLYTNKNGVIVFKPGGGVWVEAAGFTEKDGYPNQAAAEAAYTGTFTNITHTGGDLEFALVDTGPGDNQGSITYTATGAGEEQTFTEDVYLSTWSATDPV